MGVGGVYGTWSSPVDFNVSGKAVFQTTSGTTSDRTPTLTWTAVTDAARHELWVSRLDGGGVVINETQLTGTSYTPLSNLVPRAYRAWVRAVSSTGQVGPWSVSIDITVVDSDSSPSINVLGPLEGHLLTESPLPDEGPPIAEAPTIDPGMPESVEAIHGKTLDDVMSEVMSGVFFDTM